MKSKEEQRENKRRYMELYYSKNRKRLLEQSKLYRLKHKEQCKESNKKWNKKNREYLNEWHRDYRKNNKKARIRIQNYRKDNSNKIKKQNKEYYIKNHKNILDSQKKYRIVNPDKIKLQNVEYYKKNRDKILERQKKYENENKESRKEYRKKYIIKRRKEDEDYKIRTNLRIRLTKTLKKYTKTGKIMKSIKYGINYELIIEHLKPFPEEIAKYEIDHIRPLCSFKFVREDGSTDLEEVKRAFAPENHQFLLAKDNMSKGGKWIK